MIVTSKAPIRFVPPWLRPQDGPAPADAPTYLIRAGDVIERGMLEAELAGEHRAGPVYDFQLLAAFAGGIAALMPDDPDAERLIDLQRAEASGQKLPDDDARALVRARDVLTEHWPEYRALAAQIARRDQLAGILAFRRFCVGWENVPGTYARGADGLVTMDALAAVDPVELRVAGLHAFELLYAGGQEKNSSPPSKSGGDHRTSPSDEPSPAAGGSRSKTGRKTRS